MGPDLRALTPWRKGEVSANHHAAPSKLRAHLEPLPMRQELPVRVHHDLARKVPPRLGESVRLAALQRFGPALPFTPVEALLECAKERVIGNPFAMCRDERLELIPQLATRMFNEELKRTFEQFELGGANFHVISACDTRARSEKSGIRTPALQLIVLSVDDTPAQRNAVVIPAMEVKSVPSRRGGTHADSESLTLRL